MTRNNSGLVHDSGPAHDHPESLSQLASHVLVHVLPKKKNTCTASEKKTLYVRLSKNRLANFGDK
jgi:hypothetical protein